LRVAEKTKQSSRIERKMKSQRTIAHLVFADPQKKPTPKSQKSYLC